MPPEGTMLLSYSTWGMPAVPIDVAVAHCRDRSEKRWRGDRDHQEPRPFKRARGQQETSALCRCTGAGCGAQDQQAGDRGRARADEVDDNAGRQTGGGADYRINANDPGSDREA